MRRSGCGVRVSGEGGDGGGEQVSGVILAHADRDGWVGAAELAEGAMGDPPGLTVPLYAAPLRQEVVRPQRVIRKQTIREGGYPLLPTLTL
jgi:hypothetical protein